MNSGKKVIVLLLSVCAAGNLWAGYLPCPFALALLNGENLTAPELMSIVDSITRKPNETLVANKGRAFALGIPNQNQVLQEIIKEMDKIYSPDFYKTLPQEDRSGLADGNVGHIGTHNAWTDAFGPYFVEKYGIDLLSLQTAQRVHDPGKVVLHRGIAEYIDAKLERTKQDGIINDKVAFVKAFVSGHDFHSIAKALPETVKKVGEKFGLNSVQQAELLSQLIYMAFPHNSGLRNADPKLPKEKALEQLKENYKEALESGELTVAELEYIHNAFWVRFYGTGAPPLSEGGKPLFTPFAQDVGVDPTSPPARGAVGNILALIDRATIIDPYKVIDQNKNSKGFSPAALEATFKGQDGLGTSVVPLVKGVTHQLKEFATGQKVNEDASPLKYTEYLTGRIRKLGTALMKMQENAKDKLAEGEDGHVLVYETRDGELYKINGKEYNKPIVSRWVAKNNKWEKIDTPATPKGAQEVNPGNPTATEVLLGFAHKEGLWEIPDPVAWVKGQQKAVPRKNGGK